ncbi:ATP-binding protein [Halovenus halobia]|uniref:ATP-binding protein n=1 Tax=Halovenus halobia TaxID=3396622 RepID=UPI003F544249
MSTHLPVVAAVVYTLLGVIPAAVAVRSFRNRETAGAVPLLVTGVGATTASVVQAGRFLELVLAIPTPVSLALHIALLASVNIAVLGTMYVAVEYTNRGRLTRSWLVGALAFTAIGLPVGRILAGAAESPAFGPLADADFLYRVVLAAVGLGLFARQYLASRGVYRKQAGTLTVGLAIGAGLGLLERFYPLPFVEFTLLGMSGGCAVLAVALFRYDLFETAPVARETLFDYVSDPVVAIDGESRVADVNRAAMDAFAIGDDLIGQPAETVFAAEELSVPENVPSTAADLLGAVVVGDRRQFDPSNSVVEALHDGADIPETDFALVTDGELEYFSVRSTDLSVGPESAGKLVVFREVTAERERAQDLDILKEVLSRVLRHNLRNEITVIRGYASSIANKSDDGVADEADRIVDRTDVLLKTSETARAIKNVIDSAEPVPVSLVALVDRTAAAARDSYPDATIETDVSDVEVRINPEFDAALTELLENAIVHNDDDPTVTITGGRVDGGVELRVSDNGPGIPEHELAVIDRGEETSLNHGSGAGLWLIQIAADHSDGDCQFETGPEGTTVTVRLPEANPAADTLTSNS